MIKLDEMWAALAAYQLQADAAGHGESWARMCSEKTAAAASAANAAASAAYAGNWAGKAIDRIKEITNQPAAQPEHKPTLQEQLDKADADWGKAYADWRKASADRDKADAEIKQIRNLMEQQND